MTEAHQGPPGRREQAGVGPLTNPESWVLMCKDEARAQFSLAMALAWHTAQVTQQARLPRDPAQPRTTLRGSAGEKEVALIADVKRNLDQLTGGYTKCGLSIQWNSIETQKGTRH